MWFLQNVFGILIFCFKDEVMENTDTELFKDIVSRQGNILEIGVLPDNIIEIQIYGQYQWKALSNLNLTSDKL